jgi:hypothetical protein
MKRLMMTMAAVVAFAGACYAQSSSAQDPVNYNVTFVDKITLEDWVQSIVFDPFDDFSDFNNPSTASALFMVNATRSWNMKISCSDFVRQGTPPSPSIPASVEPELILKMSALSMMQVTGTDPHPQPNAPTLVASGNGGLNQMVIVNGTITPSFALNMSGVYVAEWIAVASLN